MIIYVTFKKKNTWVQILTLTALKIFAFRKVDFTFGATFCWEGWYWEATLKMFKYCILIDNKKVYWNINKSDIQFQREII